MPPERRAVLVVLDGLGIGVMPDAPAEDKASDTLGHTAAKGSAPRLPVLASLGLGNAEDVAAIGRVERPAGAYGRARLGYPGADTYMGHQELMAGSLANVQGRLLTDVRDQVVAALEGAGHTTEAVVEGQSPLIVNGCVLVADNIEARPGLNINVTASLDDISFEALTAIGQVVRDTVPVPRVIVVGGRGYTIDDIRGHVRERSPGQIGVDTPGLGVYDEHYQVRHLGAKLDLSQQLPTRAKAAGYDVALIGKAADVVRCEGADYHNIVPTQEVFDCVIDYLDRLDAGLIVANVQETDLAGHEEDPERLRDVLEEVDRNLPRILQRLRDGDALFIAADHGNDPTIGHSQHTREYVPVLASGPGLLPTDLGTRASLADVGATMADVLGVEVGAGDSFAKEIGCS